MKNSYTVIIVSWNVERLLRRCLNSLQPVAKEIEVVVVDNNSIDGTLEMIKQEFPWVKLIALPVNRGFAVANNLAAKEAQGDYLVLLNPDTWLSADFFTSLDDFWSKYPLAGVVGGQIRNQDGTIQPSVRRWPTPWSQMLVLLKLSRYSTKLLSNYLWIDFDYDQPAEVDQVMGACFICSKKNWQQFGGFDDNFFVWFEEVDFCRRLNEAGLTIRYEPSLKIGHSQAASFKQLDYVSRHVMFSRSLLYYARKHFGRGWYLPLRIAVVLGYIISYVGKIFIK